MDKRASTYSTLSVVSGVRSVQSSQVSTTTLLNNLHTSYTSGQTCSLDASTTLVVNTWLNAAEWGNATTVDMDLGRRAWEHARRRAEDACIVSCSLHPSTPSCLTPLISTLPFSIPNSIYTALAALRPFTCHVTPLNASQARHTALAATFNLSMAGSLAGASINLPTSGIDSSKGLLNIPAEAGYRAFDVFYYLITAASTPAEREFLGLKDLRAYSLLSPSQTFEPPSYLPTADDGAAAEDFRNALKAIGIKGAAHRSLISILAGLLKLGDTLGFLIDGEELEEVCEEVAGLLGLEPEVLVHKCSTDDRRYLISGLYECLVDWILIKSNQTIHAEVQSMKEDVSSDGSGPLTPNTDQDDTVSLTIVEIPGQDLGKAIAMRGVFDDTTGINAEMKDDGVEIVPAGASVLKEMSNAVNDVSADLGATSTPEGRDREFELDRRQDVLERISLEAEDGTFLRTILHPVEGEGVNNGQHARFVLPIILGSSRVWYHLSLHPTDELPSRLAQQPNPASTWSAGTVSRQLRAWRLPEWANRRHKNIDFTADFDIDEFVTRYSRLGCEEGRDGVENWLLQRGWSNGEAVIGHERIWIREGAWWEAESMLDLKSEDAPVDPFASPAYGTPYATHMPSAHGSGFFPPMAEEEAVRENLLGRQSNFGDVEKQVQSRPRSTMAPTVAKTLNTMTGDYGLGVKGDDRRNYEGEYDGHLDPEMGEPKHVTTQKMSFTRRIWTIFVWMLTFWIPSFALRFVGRMKRPDVRMAWREKLTLVALIILLNGIVVFYIIEFGHLLCPNLDKAWNPGEVAQHQGDNDFYVSFRGGVYDISKFWQINHSDVTGDVADKTTMQTAAGQNVDELFPPPLTAACQFFVKDPTISLVANNTPTGSYAFVHTSGSQTQFTSSKLEDANWYGSTFLPKMKEYYIGDLVYDQGNVSTQGTQNGHMWVIINGKIYDLTDYFNTIDKRPNLPQYEWLPEEVTSLIQSNPGQDISSSWGKDANFTASLNCFNNLFYAGIPDFRESARCQVNNYILLAFTIIICAVILIKFLSALQFGSKRRPSPQDKFVICQVPAYTEGEDAIRKGLDSLTALQYDNKRKLICVICDGMIVGGGNDRPTPKIVLDILGVDPKIDPPALPFKSVGTGSEQLNYGKVYSGLYEYEGNVVPYIVVVKVGKESEQTKSKPGNRGKRDSQILLMRFLNRVHHRSSMSPLELEMFHQINNIIGVDPELYEYLFMVDADTSVREDSLNRLVAACANDSKIAGICGETSLQNEERSWWTMIQVYEYYISHHLAKAFESLFGSVTCLPGCFCMYRLRTADKGRPLIVSDKVIDEYSDGNVDTLHKKNLLSLGEDRYLTTLMTKHFPAMSYKFVPDAFAATAAPETWGVLLSQRRRWINSTIHNLAELVFLKDLCGFCFFSMRFVVFIDLFGTLILPATCAYLGYLIYTLITHTGQIPIISLALLGGVYGLQALIFLLKRQWQHIGWMIIYLIAYPVYSLALPLYSFWKQDDFSWGNTRIVIGEKGTKQIIAMQDEGFDPRSIPLQRWDDYAAANNLPGKRGNNNVEKPYDAPAYSDNVYEMDEMRSVYSSARPDSTVLTGFHNHPPAYMPPHMSRHATMTSLAKYADAPQYQSRTSPRNGTPDPFSPYRDSTPNLGRSTPMMQSQDNLLGQISPGMRSSQNLITTSRPPSSMGLRVVHNAPDELAIAEAVRSCLAEVDLDSVTKKQVRALVEQRLQTEIGGEQRVFLDRQIDNELSNMYTASFAFFEALWEAGVRNCFVNLGSDHPSIIEAIVKGQQEKPNEFPKIYTCPNEMVALSMADGYARASGQPQCVIVHVDVGTQGLGAAVHNASTGRCPVLIFAGLSPYTLEGELRGSRTEYIHWIQDVPDQKQILAQYCRYTGEIKTGRNVKQMVNRALQFALSEPKGPVYLYGAREAMEEEIEPYSLKKGAWGPVGAAALPEDAVTTISEALMKAKEPLVIAGYSGRDTESVGELLKLADSIPGLRVLETGGCDMCFPQTHRASLGLRYGVDPSITTADVILVLHCDVPWIPTHNRPKDSARVFHIDSDPLKRMMPVFYIEAEGRWGADATTALEQLNMFISGEAHVAENVRSETYFPEMYARRGAELDALFKARMDSIKNEAEPPSDGSISTSLLTATLRQLCPKDTIFAVEAVTNTALVTDQLLPEIPGSFINCGGGGLGWSGGGALGIKLASVAKEREEGKKGGKGKFVVQIVGDGTFLFSVPGSVYWIASRYNIPVLTVVLNNIGWNAPRKSLLLVHPDGPGSKVSNSELNISFDPTPDYAGIAAAATGYKAWSGIVSSAAELEGKLGEAIRAVEGGRVAVLDAQLGGKVGKYVADEGGKVDGGLNGEVKEIGERMEVEEGEGGEGGEKKGGDGEGEGEVAPMGVAESSG